MSTSVVVTGAARGIGRAIAERMVARGHRVVLTDVDGDGLTDIGEVDTNADGYTDYLAVDSDADGDPDVALIDTDYDGNPDEVLSGDSVPFPGGSDEPLYDVRS